MEKTSPMQGDVFFTGDRRTYRQTDGHRDSMTESAQWADSVKRDISPFKETYCVPWLVSSCNFEFDPIIKLSLDLSNIY